MVLPRRPRLAFLVWLACAVAAAPAAGAQRDGWDPALIEQWVSAIETHAPGSLDAPLAGATGWDSTALRKLWADIHVLLVITVIGLRHLLREASPQVRAFAIGTSLSLLVASLGFAAVQNIAPDSAPGAWILEPMGDGKKTRVTYQLHTHPGGSIPSWIANKSNTIAIPDLFKAVKTRSEKVASGK